MVGRLGKPHLPALPVGPSFTWLPTPSHTHPHGADQAAQEELAADVRGEASKIGEIHRLVVHGAHPEAPIVVRFKSSGAATAAISVFNGRWFGGRRITCEFWDGQTDYGGGAPEETEADEKTRLDAFGAWLEGEAEPGGALG